MSPPPARVLVLGIDAASPALLTEWAADGTLPNIAALIDRGLVGRTRNLDGFFVGSTWPSLYTGVSPARHGVHYMVQLQSGTYDLYAPAEREFVRCDPFWRAASDAGRRVAVFDVPLTRLNPSLNGMQVVEWGGHDALYGFQTSPATLAGEILSAFGPHPVGSSCDADRRTAEDYRRFTDALVRGARTKAAMTRQFLARGDWDLFMQVFTESHCAGHQCWHLHDGAHPAHDPAIVAIAGDPMRQVYAAIDASIGEVLADAGDALVIVVAAHGMSYWYGAHFLLREILFRLGVATPPAAAPAPAGLRAAARAAVKGVWMGLPAGIRSALAPLRERVRPPSERRGAAPTIGVDTGVSRCFPLSNGLAVSGIRLNLAGREPRGTLEPGAAAEAFIAQLRADLLDIVDERTGGPLIRRVLRTADLYAGPRLNDLPDLLVEWSDDVPTGSTSVGAGANAVVRARSPKIGVIEGANGYGRTGEHRPEGMFIASAPGVRPGRLGRVVSILDFAPTIASLLGVSLKECDGTAIAELIRDR